MIIKYTSFIHVQPYPLTGTPVILLRAKSIYKADFGQVMSNAEGTSCSLDNNYLYKSIIEEIKSIDIDKMTPMESINILFDLIKKSKEI